MATPVPRMGRRAWVYAEGVILLLLCGLVLTLVYLQFRGDFTPKTELTMVATRAGLVMEPGSKVTYNGVEIGRVAGISEIERDGAPAAKLLLDVDPRYIELIPANVVANIEAATLFGNKYVSLIAPENASRQRISPHDVIDARSVTTIGTKPASLAIASIIALAMPWNSAWLTNRSRASGCELAS